METMTYTALCEKAGRWWSIRILQVEGLTVQVRSLDQADLIARQSIARALGIPVEVVAIELVPDVPPTVTYALQARNAARQAAETADMATREALEALARDGYMFHDAATMLGLSPAEIEHYRPGRDTDSPIPDDGPMWAAG